MSSDPTPEDTVLETEAESRRDAGEPIPEELRGAPDPEVARIQRNMDLLCGLSDDPFAEEG